MSRPIRRHRLICASCGRQATSRLTLLKRGARARLCMRPECLVLALDRQAGRLFRLYYGPDGIKMS